MVLQKHAGFGQPHHTAAGSHQAVTVVFLQPVNLLRYGRLRQMKALCGTRIAALRRHLQKGLNLGIQHGGSLPRHHNINLSFIQKRYFTL